MFRAQRVHTDRQRWQDRADDALCRNGSGHIYRHPDADRGRTGGGPQGGPSRTRAAQRETLRQPAAGCAGDRRLDHHSRRLDPLRGAGAVARTMLIAAAAKRWNVDPASCRARNGEVSTNRPDAASRMANLAADAARMPAPSKVMLKRAGGFQTHRHARETSGRPGQGQRQRRLRDRHAPAGHEGRDPRAVAGVWRSREKRGWHGRDGGQGGASGRQDWMTQSRSWPIIWARRRRASPPWSSNGTMDPMRSSALRISSTI